MFTPDFLPTYLSLIVLYYLQLRRQVLSTYHKKIWETVRNIEMKKKSVSSKGISSKAYRDFEECNFETYVT
jgi:hypothetical protein